MFKKGLALSVYSLYRLAESHLDSLITLRWLSIPFQTGGIAESVLFWVFRNVTRLSKRGLAEGDYYSNSSQMHITSPEKKNIFF